MTQRRALLFPAIPAVLTADERAHVRVVDFGQRRVLTADGVLGQEVLGVAEGREPGPRLAMLGPLGAVALKLQRAERVELTPLAAIRMQSFDTLFLELTLRCTERCVHCYANAGPHRGEQLDRATCLAVLEDAAALGFRRVQFTGGDPLLCAFLPDLLERGRALGFDLCEVFTNGLLLTEHRLAELAPFEPSFAFSLYSADPAVHDAITGVAGSHRLTCDAIARACARSLTVRVAVVEMEQNAGTVEETFALARSLGAGSVSASGSHSVGRGDFVERSPGTQPARGAAGCEPTCRHESAEHLGTLCVAGDGAVYPCVFNRADRLGSVLARPLREIVARPDSIAGGADPAQFLDEVRRRLQCIGCQCTAFALRSC